VPPKAPDSSTEHQMTDIESGLGMITNDGLIVVRAMSALDNDHLHRAL
jgi:hypothetical protein